MTLIGAGRIRFGGHVAVGDVNGDGYDELVLSDDSRTSMGRSSAGEVYIVRGSSVFPTGTASVTDRAFRTIVGPAPSPRAANIHADMVSDFSGDGMADVGLIVNDTPVLVNGADIWAFGPTIDLQPGQSNEVHKMVFQDPLGRSGTWAGSGDFDGDGRADLSLQWYKYTTPTSKVSLYLSHSFSIGNPWPTTISTASIDIEYLTMIDHVSGLGDINGDGKSDLVMTASGVPDDIRIFYGFTPLENPSIRVADRAPDQARVHLSLSVDGDPTEMKLSGNFLDAIKDQWVPFQGDVDLTLSPSEENKTITVVFRNSLLRESEPVSASLSLAAGSTGTSVVTNLLREGGTALFEIRLEAPSHLKAAVYSREARLLRTLINETKSAGVHVVEWDGANNEGQRVAPGVYTVVVDRDGQIDPRRVLVK
ncbi:MAG: FG-GAP repeat protein [Elusimicrobia bacterium]|nr:FG-GAP repeat protein [Elusimicrobiota bacterium]